MAANLFGSSSLGLHPGRRNQYNAGLQQAIGKWLLLDLDYFWKYTNNAYDFSTLLKYHDYLFPSPGTIRNWMASRGA